MAFTNVIRRAVSRVIPSAINAIESRRYYHHQSCSTLFSTAAPITRIGALSQNLLRSSFSTAIQRIHARKLIRIQRQSNTRRESDATLLKVINSEILCAEEELADYDKVEDVPENFPFKIKDEPGKQTLTLTRDDEGESITVEVHIPEPMYLKDENDNENDEKNDEERDKECDDSDEFDLPMAVKVSKNDGPCLEFGVSAYNDKIEIETLSIKGPATGEDDTAYKGPEFGELDEELQKAFHKYLDIRGINPSSTRFLHDYMLNKDSKEYVGWLKKAKKIVEG